MNMQRAKCISVIYDSIVINVVDSCPGEPVGVLRSSGLSVSQKQPWQGLGVPSPSAYSSRGSEAGPSSAASN